MPPDERDEDATHALTPEETQALTSEERAQALPPDESTQAMPSTDESTHAMPMDVPLGSTAEPTRRMDPPPAAEHESTRRMTYDTVRPAYATERIVVPARPSLAPWLIALVVIVGLIVGGVLGYSQARPSDNNVVARALVSPRGGVMKFDGAGSLTVPEGALSSPTAITIRRDTLDHPVRLGAEDDPRSVTYDAGELVVYAFEPSDLRFQQPVTIELPRAGDGTAVFVDVRGSPHVVAGEPNGKTVKVQTLSFSFAQSDGGTVP